MTLTSNDTYVRIRRLLIRFFDTSRYTTAETVYRAQAVYAVTMLVLVTMTIYSVSVPEWTTPDGIADRTLMHAALLFPSSDPGILFFSMYFIGGLTFIANRLGLSLVARWSPVALWLVSGVTLIAFTSVTAGDPGGAIVVLLIIAATLANVRGIYVAIAASITVLLLRSGMVETYFNPQGSPSFYSIVFQTLGAGGLTYLLLSFARISRQAGATEAVENRVVAEEIVTRLARLVSRRSTLNELLTEAVNSINDQFENVYHTQIFLVEETGNHARLVASTGSIGAQLLARKHSLPVGSRSVIGQVTLNGDPVIAHAGASGAVHKRNELLLETRVEGAFPLRVGDRIIGALDLQSRDPNAFDTSVIINTFQALADSVSLAIDNIQQYERAEARLKENEQLVREAQEAYRQVSRMNERLTGEGWKQYLKVYDQGHGLMMDFDANQLLANEEETQAIQDAISINQLVQSETDDHQVIAVPLRVGGRVIGAMEFELEREQNFTPEDLDLVQEVTERFGYAVENARLVDESQRLALREFLISQITDRVQNATDADSILAEVAQGLQDVLNAERVAIRLKTNDASESDGS